MKLIRQTPLLALITLLFMACSSKNANNTAIDSSPEVAVHEASSTTNDAAKKNKKKRKKIKPTFKVKEEGLYAEMQTNRGNILIKLEMEKTPVTVANFVGLAEGTINNTAKESGEPYYDGLVFHRVINDFMVQGGDPTGTGAGGPGYKFPDEIDPSLKHIGPGVLSMANAGPGTNGSQFFITHVATPWLDGKHTVFGNVVEGMDVVNAIKQNDTIEHVIIIREGKMAKNFKIDDVKFEAMKSEMVAKAQERMKAARSAYQAEFDALVKAKFPNAQKTESGLHYVITEPGNGQNASAGNKVKVHYKGYFPDGRTFDSSFDRNEPIEFPLGAGNVIKGWDEGIALLNTGAKATLIIPYWLGYGEAGRGPIPPKATLLFDVQLVSFK